MPELRGGRRPAPVLARRDRDRVARSRPTAGSDRSAAFQSSRSSRCSRASGSSRSTAKPGSMVRPPSRTAPRPASAGAVASSQDRAEGVADDPGDQADRQGQQPRTGVRLARRDLGAGRAAGDPGQERRRARRGLQRSSTERSASSSRARPMPTSRPSVAAVPARTCTSGRSTTGPAVTGTGPMPGGDDARRRPRSAATPPRPCRRRGSSQSAAMSMLGRAGGDRG